MEGPARWNPFDGRPDEGKAPFDGKPRSITPSVRPSVPASSHKGGETGPHATKKRGENPPHLALGWTVMPSPCGGVAVPLHAQGAIIQGASNRRKRVRARLCVCVCVCVRTRMRVCNHVRA